MRGGDSERRTIPVRGCLSVAVGDPMRSPNPREGIHGSPRIARITRVSAESVCENLRERWAVWLGVVHWCFFDGAKIRKIGIGLVFGIWVP